MRTTRLALLAGIAGLLIPVAVTSSASAVDQDLQVSATAGPARTEIAVTSASCPTGEDPLGEGIGILRTRLIAGTAPNEVLAGFSIGFMDSDATMVVPDWIDPAEPAVVEAECLTVSIEGDEVVQTTFDYDPVPFDVEPSAEAPVQSRTFSRTSLLAGQGFAVDGTGCFLDDAEYSSVEVVTGTDLTLRTAEEAVANGEGDMDGDTFRALTAMANGYVSVGALDADPDEQELTAVPTDIPPGEYTAVTYCSNEELDLVFEPQIIEVTGSAPIDDIALTVPAESRTATFAGGSCATGPVQVQLDAWDDADFDEDEILSFDARAKEAGSRPLSGPGLASSIERALTGGDRTAMRALSDDGYLEADLTPEGGAWSISDDVDFDQGFVEGYAVCGDPLADGFLYDPQVATVAVTPEPTTTTTGVPTPAPQPAQSIPGNPTYAG